jgi:hypothetical protein
MAITKTIVPMHGRPIARAGASPAHLSYGNGHLLTSVQVYTIFWGAAWQQSAQSTLLTQLNQFFDSILASSLMDLLVVEYSVAGQIIGHGRRTGSMTITDTEPGGTSKQVTDAEIQQALQRWLTNGTIPPANANTLYFAYLPPGVTATDSFGDVSCQQMCGYHWFISGNPEVYYAVMPFPGCDGCLGGLSRMQALTSTSSHELCEAITDPHPWTGWNDSSNGEIGDICAWQTGTVNGFTVQKEWSNAQDACALGPFASRHLRQCE